MGGADAVGEQFELNAIALVVCGKNILADLQVLADAPRLVIVEHRLAVLADSETDAGGDTVVRGAGRLRRLKVHLNADAENRGDAHALAGRIDDLNVGRDVQPRRHGDVVIQLHSLFVMDHTPDNARQFVAET